MSTKQEIVNEALKTAAGPMVEIPPAVVQKVVSALIDAHIFIDNADKPGSAQLADQVSDALSELEDAIEDHDAVEP